MHRWSVTRFGLARLIGTSGLFEPCAETDNARTARQLFVNHQPKIVLLGLTLRYGDGIQLIKDLRKLDPWVKALVLSAREDALSIHRALRAGARGYLLAGDDAGEVLRALEEISTGHRYVSAGVLNRIIENFTVGKADEIAFELNSLSDRELEILSLMGKGLGVSKLAAELCASPKTIESHQQRMKEKLRLHSGSALKEKAVQWLLKSARKRLQMRPLANENMSLV